MARHKKFSSIGITLDPLKLFKTNKRKIKTISVHCAATLPDQNVDAYTVDRWHKGRWGSGIGYHLFLTRKGKLQKGRWFDFRPAAVFGFNKKMIAVCYEGGLGYNGKVSMDSMPKKQYKILVRTLRTLVKQYPDVIIKGHNEFPLVKKDCPCINMDKLRSDVYSR